VPGNSEQKNKESDNSSKHKEALSIKAQSRPVEKVILLSTLASGRRNSSFASKKKKGEEEDEFDVDDDMPIK
jgi:hypothetical protein